MTDARTLLASGLTSALYGCWDMPGLKVAHIVFHAPCLTGGVFHNVNTCHPFQPTPEPACFLCRRTKDEHAARTDLLHTFTPEPK